jgi:hypothetical protein
MKKFLLDFLQRLKNYLQTTWFAKSIFNLLQRFDDYTATMGLIPGICLLTVCSLIITIVVGILLILIFSVGPDNNISAFSIITLM